MRVDGEEVMVGGEGPQFDKTFQVIILVSPGVLPFHADVAAQCRRRAVR